ncbi:TetR/AcrR family transcriptional regulator [Amycolatopsis lexingtonensis]|uniref:TetR/AcrR family transcriptional regulator n=1 Tax=Amycolatopsis lexingtonensis TaxID=218822 RepID=UPI003F70B930
MGDVKGAKTTRRYNSAVREESARRTRQAITAAAAELFVARGYDATSLADIASAAGVARPTVFAAFGSKAALLKWLVDQALAGDDEPVAVADRPWFQPVWQAKTQRAVLDAYAEVCTLIGARAWPLFEVVRRAADPASDVADLWATLVGNRRAGAAMVIDRLREFGPLRDPHDRAVDALWVLNDPAHYGSLVNRCGWTAPEFRTWLSNQMAAALL